MFCRCRLSTVICWFVLVIQFSLLVMIHHLVYENAELKAAMKKSPEIGQAKRHYLTNDTANDGKSFQSTSKSSKITKIPRDFAPYNITIILFKQPIGRLSENDFNKQLTALKLAFPSSLITWSENIESLGKSLNRQISQAKTEYFLFLESHASLSNRPQESIASLWNALEQFPELDFVGGSYLSEGKLRVPCDRFRLCKWTFSESYEYERSLDNVMICDGISSSFMGRTDSVKKVKGGFDEKIPDLLVVKDFFLRAKTSNVVAGTRPNVMFLTDQLKSLYQLWSSQDITNELVPFAVKHKVFIFKDIDGNVIELCSATSPLSGRGLCIEKNSHKLMLGGGHWAYQGLFTYPYLMKYLEITLSVVINFFNQHNVSYSVSGGLSLGAIKTRSILPWEAGDIDIDVYEIGWDKLYNFLKPLTEKGYIVRKHSGGPGDAVHVFCTPKNVGDVSGGLATIFPHPNSKTPPKSELIKVQTNGIWVTYVRNLIPYLMKKYGKRYLEHKLYGRRGETIECKIKGHNACLPNFKSLFQGRGGNLREFYCET